MTTNGLQNGLYHNSIKSTGNSAVYTPSTSINSAPLADKYTIGESIGSDEEEVDVQASTQITVDLTPSMVNAQFTLIDQYTPTDEKMPPDAFPNGNRMPATNIPVSAQGPVPREKREEELEYFMTKKYNRLGAKIQARTNTLNNLVTDRKLILE